jgi:Tetrapyrrole (Corrin/Porphyrin) Methylases
VSGTAAVPARGSLAAIGVGIRAGLQTTPEAREHLRSCSRAFFLVADPLARAWIEALNPAAESLQGYYAVGTSRLETYDRIAERLLTEVRAGERVCAAAYGHPGIFATPLHLAVRRAREEGLRAVMLPAISAEDCLFADLGLDPGDDGAQSYEATDFLIRRRPFDRSSLLVLWQVGLIGVRDHRSQKECWNPAGLKLLGEVLAETYGAEHPAIVYCAATLPLCDPRIIHTTLGSLGAVAADAMATLVVRPAMRRAVDPGMAKRVRATAAALLEAVP